MILFSHDIFSAQVAGGVSRCMIELMRALGGTTDWRLWAGRYTNELLDNARHDPAIAAHLLAAHTVTGGGRLSGSIRNEPGFVKAVRAQHATVVHRTYYPVLDLVPNRHVSRVETLMDMWDERGGAGATRLTALKTRIKHRALSRADAIVCISASSRAEMLDKWPALEARSLVIPLGVRRLSDRPLPALRKRPYFLFVGRRGTYKNFAVAVAGLRAAALDSHELLCFGGGAFDDAELATIAAAGLAGRVHQIGGGDDRLAGLYEGATALLYPSAYEGFGLPLLEAMIHDCPVIAAPLTSLPEVGGSAAVYANPAMPDEWGMEMARIGSSSAVADERRRAGRQRAAEFSWSKTAASHAALYSSLR
ncbi:glycosyltransferase family 4 protein [Polymorphobacter fuscus]|uniref:Glycosyltransferase n=1 Tax=Sandarakinorhabdus fusca TaxID=1439888 RepID=A0A7C9KX33_9SPHN|nr:glycosyltransferase family 1 protein [Polymorphobacter fuscus]KAB7646304.1 glycosyltransferase family 4 protein [Polymorphobacter fuscus]MQT17525.1 glycosyltransferase [Polymorphobacter fuscus]NJC09936.1 glycosyltransferase involved in cell wall biosynthesis [Polymorphobacter fuscus]